MRILEFKDYCGKLVLKSRIYLLIIFILPIVLAFNSAKPKVVDIPGNKYLLFAVLKYNYAPEDYERTFLKWELQSPLIDRKKLIDTVQRERLYSYFRPSSARKLQEEGSWIVCGRRIVYTDSPAYKRLREGKFCVRLKNISGKIFVDREWWRKR